MSQCHNVTFTYKNDRPYLGRSFILWSMITSIPKAAPAYSSLRSLRLAVGVLACIKLGKKLPEINQKFLEVCGESVIFADDNQNYIIMKRIINIVFAAMVLSLVPASYACAQTIDNLRPPTRTTTPPKKKPAKKKWNHQGDFYEGLARVEDANGKWGFIDKTGKVVIPCQWNVALSFSEGLAGVKDANGRYGFIDKTGKVVIPCQWKWADSFHEGLVLVQDDNGKWHKIDKTGKVVE